MIGAYAGGFQALPIGTHQTRSGRGHERHALLIVSPCLQMHPRRQLIRREREVARPFQESGARQGIRRGPGHANDTR